MVAAFALAPLGYVLVRGGGSPGRLLHLLGAPTTLGYLLHTVLLAVVVPVVCVVLGLALAVLVVRTDLPGRRWWAVLFALPLGIPSFVSSYAWVATSYQLAPSSTALFGLDGAVVILSLSLFPYVFLPAVATLRGLDPAQEETARALGRGRWSAFIQIVLPQLKPALTGGALIIALHMLAEYGALVLLRYPTLTTAIMARYEFGRQVEALLLSTLLTVVCLVLLVADVLLRGRISAPRLGSGVARVGTPQRLGWWRTPALLAAVLVVAASLGVPLASILNGLAEKILTGGLGGFDWTGLATAAGVTAQVGALAAVAATIAAVPISLLTTRYPGPLSLVTERATWVARSLPGIVVALAFVYLAAHYFYPLYQSMTLLVIGYLALFLPLAVSAQRAGFIHAAPRYDEMSRVLGHGPWRTFARVTMPLALPGIASGAMLVFLDVGKELTATLLLRPTGTSTLATALWTETELLDFGAAAPYALALIAVSAIPAYLLARRMLR